MRRISRLSSAAISWIAIVSVAQAQQTTAPDELARWLLPQSWQRDTDGPVISLGEQGKWDDTHIFAPTVALEDGQFQLWYCGSQGTRYMRTFKLGLASSDNGKNFVKFARNPMLEFSDGRQSILTPALARRGDGAVVREAGKLRMWFSATDFDQTQLHTLHEATSSDGVDWSAPSAPLLEHVYCPSVLKTDDGRYRMWYSDVRQRPWRIRYAESADGTHWEVRPEAVLDFTQPWESGILVYPTVLCIDGVYLMWYGSHDSRHKQTTAIGFAASLDGIDWHKHPQNPVLRPDAARPWESNYVTSGCVIRLPDGGYRYWYASRTKPPFVNLYYAINTARWAGPPHGNAEGD